MDERGSSFLLEVTDGHKYCPDVIVGSPTKASKQTDKHGSVLIRFKIRVNQFVSI